MLGIRGGASHLQGGERTKQEELAEEQYQAVVPLLPARTDASMKEYWRFYLTSVSAIIIFGGLLAPVLEVKMGLGGAGLPPSAGGFGSQRICAMKFQPLATPMLFPWLGSRSEDARILVQAPHTRTS